MIIRSQAYGHNLKKTNKNPLQKVNDKKIGVNSTPFSKAYSNANKYLVNFTGADLSIECDPNKAKEYLERGTNSDKIRSINTLLGLAQETDNQEHKLQIVDHLTKEGQGIYDNNILVRVAAIGGLGEIVPGLNNESKKIEVVNLLAPESQEFYSMHETGLTELDFNDIPQTDEEASIEALGEIVPTIRSEKKRHDIQVMLLKARDQNNAPKEEIDKAVQKIAGSF